MGSLNTLQIDAVSKNTQESTIADTRYLTFILGNEHYGIHLLRVREIIALVDITPVPKTKDYLRGVINLRGKVIPVIDLRARFDMAAQEDHPRKCIVIVDISDSSPVGHIGLLVDAVSEVLGLKQDEIQDSKTVEMGIDTKFISGIANKDSEVKILLCVDSILDTNEGYSPVSDEKQDQQTDSKL